MTWSIVARDLQSGQFGIAVATRAFAVGALAPHVRSGVGAIATQALVNRFYGTEGLELLRQGLSAQDVVAAVTAADAGRAYRQVHVMDAHGGIAAHTGADCIPWCGHCAAENVSVAGNMLAGPQVIEATLAAYRSAAALPFPRRLIAALQAGEAAGGDKRGKQSAALTIHGEDDWPDLDLRVDDHPDPLAELSRLETVSRHYAMPFQRHLPSHRDRVGVTDRGLIERGIAEAAKLTADRQ